MLKLMRLEKTSIFAIVDDDLFESEMDILGYVRMDVEASKHYVRIFEAHGDEWLNELNSAIEEKEKTLISAAKYVSRTLNLENIIISYLSQKGQPFVKIGVVKKLVRYLLSEIQRQGYLFNFRNYDQLDDENIKAQLEGCKEVLVDRDRIVISIFEPDATVDFRIEKMIKEFIAKEEK